MAQVAQAIHRRRTKRSCTRVRSAGNAGLHPKDIGVTRSKLNTSSNLDGLQTPQKRVKRPNATVFHIETIENDHEHTPSLQRSVPQRSSSSPAPALADDAKYRPGEEH